MVRVYFDWNVFSYLKQRRLREEPFKTLYSIIKSADKNILFPYSPAHLRDLQRGFGTTEESKLLTYQDLKFLEEISKNHCLYLDYINKKNVTPAILNPTKYFDDIKKNTSKEYTFEELFESTEDSPLSSLLSAFKNIPTGIDLSGLNELPKKYGNFKNAFPSTNEENTFYSVLKDLTTLMSSPENMEEAYKSARNASIEGFKIDTNSKNWGNDPFDYIHKALSKAKVNKTFHEMIESELKISKQGKELTRFDYFTKYYLSLDVFGYYRDAKFSNLIDDATHAFYGAYCDYFITDDDNTYHKTKAVYKLLNIETKVCKSTDFATEHYKTNEFNNTGITRSLTDNIIDAIQYSFIVLDTVDDELNHAKVHKIQYPIADYFNRMQISYYKNSTVLFFYRRRANYSDFMFWTEIKSIVNKIVSEYGVDNNLRGEFNITDEENLSSSENSAIRTWYVKNKTIEIIDSPEPFGLSLRIRIPK